MIADGFDLVDPFEDRVGDLRSQVLAIARINQPIIVEVFWCQLMVEISSEFGQASGLGSPSLVFSSFLETRFEVDEAAAERLPDAFIGFL